MAAAKSATVNAITITMVVEKETKNAVRYADSTPDSVVPTLYVQKAAFEDGKFPQSITVTITV